MIVGFEFKLAGVIFSAPAIERTCFRGNGGVSSCATGTVDSLSSLRRFVLGFCTFELIEGGDWDCEWDWDWDWD